MFQQLEHFNAVSLGLSLSDLPHTPKRLPILRIVIERKIELLSDLSNESLMHLVFDEVSLTVVDIA
jgi:hypothetical protein